MLRSYNAFFYSQKPSKERGISLPPHFQAARKNRAPMSGWQDHYFNKPKPRLHSGCLPWHSGAAQMLERVLRANKKIFQRLPGQTTTHGTVFSHRLKRQTAPTTTTTLFPSFSASPRDMEKADKLFSLLFHPLILRNSPNLDQCPSKVTSWTKYTNPYYKTIFFIHTCY